MTKKRIALTQRLLDAMRACPRGKRLHDYADDIHRCRTNVYDAASALLKRGLVVRMRAGVPVLWTAAEHAEALVEGVRAEKERRHRELEESGVLAERRAQAKIRKKAAVKRCRERKKAQQPQRETKARRYEWPDVDVWTPPPPRVPSVWELGRIAA